MCVFCILSNKLDLFKTTYFIIIIWLFYQLVTRQGPDNYLMHWNRGHLWKYDPVIAVEWTHLDKQLLVSTLLNFFSSPLECLFFWDIFSTGFYFQIILLIFHKTFFIVIYTTIGILPLVMTDYATRGITYAKSFM